MTEKIHWLSSNCNNDWFKKKWKPEREKKRADVFGQTGHCGERTFDLV